jgi:hypothetical protein
MRDAIESNPQGFSVSPPGSAPEKMQPLWPTLRLTGRVLRKIRSMLGLPTFLRVEDRRVLEQIIFPYFLNDGQCRDVLFVGCDWYTQGYHAWFRERNYWTIDVNPMKCKFGAKHHIVDGLQNVSGYFPHGSLDLIVCNGVFGCGLDAAADVEGAISGCHETLRDGGVLVIGVNDLEEWRPRALETSGALHAFEPYTFPPLQTADYLTDTPYRHRYLFFRKPR